MMLKEIKRIFEKRKQNLQKRLSNRISPKDKFKTEGAIEEIDMFISTLDHFHDYLSKQKLLSDHLDDYHEKSGIKEIFRKLMREKQDRYDNIKKGLPHTKLTDIDTSIDIPEPEEVRK
ncbi:hypothetical protein JW968_01590 [Candidatus Woesearchaeota archaeon]|nr:hypothetical protein [Candidatus Woesearchaeota archaeon]